MNKSEASFLLYAEYVELEDIWGYKELETRGMLTTFHDIMDILYEQGYEIIKKEVV